MLGIGSQSFAASPTVTLTPANNSTNVSESTTIKAKISAGTFKASTVTPSTFFLKTAPSGATCSNATGVVVSTIYPVTFDAGNPQTMTMSLAGGVTLQSGTQYLACVTSSVQNSTGSAVTAAQTTFKVRYYAPPDVASYTPSTGVSSNLTPSLSVTFTEPMDTSTLTTASLQIWDVTASGWVASNNPVFSADASGNTVATFTPSASLTLLHDYMIAVNNPGTVKNISGVVMSGNRFYSFIVDNTAPNVNSYSPSPNNTFVNSTLPTISATFDGDLDPATISVSGGTQSVFLKKGATAIGINASFNNVNNTLTITPSAALSDGTYTVTLKGGSGACTNCLKDLATPTANIFAADLVWNFTVDTVEPVIASVTPTNGQTNVLTTDPIVISFTELNTMNQATLNNANITVQDSSGNPVVGTISYDSTNKKVTFTPTSLAFNTTYTVNLVNISDTAGNLITPVSWQFTTVVVTESAYNILPTFVSAPVVPNVLIILDNSNSMDEDMVGNAIGSPHCSNPTDPNSCSKSVIARNALTNIINTYAGKMNIGLMSFSLSSASKYKLHNSFYFNSYDAANYCPSPPPECYNYCVNEDPKSGVYAASTDETICKNSCTAQNALFKANYWPSAASLNWPGREPMTTTKGTYTGNVNTGTAIGSAKRQTYCNLIYPKTQMYTDPNGVAIYYKTPGTMYSGSNEGTRYMISTGYNSKEYPGNTDSYSIYSAKTGTSDGNVGYSSLQSTSGFVPTDSDYAMGFYDFGQRNYWYYTSQTWFSNSSPGGGWLHREVARNTDSPTNTQLNALLAKIGGNRTPQAFQNDETGYMACTSTAAPNTCAYIVNSGLTPTAGTLQTATDYFNGSLTQSSVNYNSPINYRCQKNYIIFVTDGAPSVSETGTADTSANLISAVLTKLDGLRCPTSGATSANCKIQRVFSGTNYKFDVKTFILGMGLKTSDQQYLDQMAVHGGTDSSGKAFYANNATDLNNALVNIFQNILLQISSGTAASILNNSQGSGANLLQAVFYPSKTFDSNTTATWIGELHNLWYFLDPFFTTSTIREDSNKDYILGLKNDYVTTFRFDTTQNSTVIDLSQDTKGDGSTYSSQGTVQFDGLKSLWKTGRLLWERNLSTDPRTVYTVTSSTFGSSLLKFSSDAADNFSSNATVRTYLQAADQTEANKIIDYVKGTDQSGYRGRKVTISGCGLSDSQGCTREWKLGDIVNSTPKLVSNVPLDNYDLAPSGGYGDTSYSAFINSKNYKQRGMAFVGANDGMLHAIRLGVLDTKTQTYVDHGATVIDVYKKAKLVKSDLVTTVSALDQLGREEWAFIPKNTLPYLKYLGDANYNHLYYVDSSVTLIDASINPPSDNDGVNFPGCDASSYWNCQKKATKATPASCLAAPNSAICDLDLDKTSWRTILIGGMGLGGASRNNSAMCTDLVATGTCTKTPIPDVGYSSYFALDVTNPATLPPASGAVRFLWEFNASGQLGHTISAPAIVRVGSASKNGRWFAVFGSGPTGPIDTTNHAFLGKSDQTLKLFVVDIGTGNLAATIDTGISNAFAGSLTSAVIDTDKASAVTTGFYQDDAVYVGYVQSPGTPSAQSAWSNSTTYAIGDVVRYSGINWRCIQAHTNQTPSTSNSTFWTSMEEWKGGVIRLLTMENTDPTQWKWSYLIKDTGPVTTSISKLIDRGGQLGTSSTYGKLWIYFGTGRYFHKTDSLGDQFTLYGVMDPCYNKNSGSPTFALTGPSRRLATADNYCTGASSATPPTGATVTESLLLDQTGTSTTAPATSLPFDRYGWLIRLATSENLSGTNFASERVVSTPTAAPNGGVFFTTFLPSADVCGFGGNTYLWALDYRTGGAPSAAVLKGNMVIQLSTGELKQVSLGTAFGGQASRQDLNNRRSNAPLTGGSSNDQQPVFTPPKAAKKIMHYQEK
jgi:hypothetical protein